MDEEAPVGEQRSAKRARVRAGLRIVVAALLGALSAVGALPLESVAALQVAIGAL